MIYEIEKGLVNYNYKPLGFCQPLTRKKNSLYATYRRTISFYIFE